MKKTPCCQPRNQHAFYILARKNCINSCTNTSHNFHFSHTTIRRIGNTIILFYTEKTEAEKRLCGMPTLTQPVGGRST